MIKHPEIFFAVAFSFGLGWFFARTWPEESWLAPVGGMTLAYVGIWLLGG